ncbi:hypothetical protein [Acidocella sp.]|jgi:hypothetical protein|uniref:hypothetical protein n=1 Tax=Acidocella sp. TaxID=50710 RepID=UPI002F41A097
MTEKKPDAPKPETKIEAAAEERLHPILTNDEVRAAQAKARKKIDDERRKLAAKMVEEQETRRLQEEENLRPDDDPGGEMVTIQIDLAPYASFGTTNGKGLPGMSLDGRRFWQGQIVTVKRRVADSIRDIMYRTWQHEHSLKGEPLIQFYQSQRLTEVNARSGAVRNAPTGA